MRARLTIIAGKATKKELSLKVPLIIGRSRSAGLTIAHPMVSRHHCEVVESDGLLRIRDLGSTNGTYVGGEKITEAVLHPHEQFSVGPLTFEINYKCAANAVTDEEESNDRTASSGAVPGFVAPPPVIGLAPLEDLGLAPVPGIAPPNGEVPDVAVWSNTPDDAVAASEDEGLLAPPPSPPLLPQSAPEAPGTAAPRDRPASLVEEDFDGQQ